MNCSLSPKMTRPCTVGNTEVKAVALTEEAFKSIGSAGEPVKDETLK